MCCFTDAHGHVVQAGSSAEAHGVMRESWFNVQYDPKLAPDMLTNPTFKTSPQGQNIIRNFDAPVNAAESYVQRLAAHIQVIFRSFCLFVSFFLSVFIFIRVVVLGSYSDELKNKEKVLKKERIAVLSFIGGSTPRASSAGMNPAQTLSLYLRSQVETSGNYTFYMACDDMCELWKFDVHEDGMDDKLDEDENAVQKSDRLMFLPKFTGHLEWKR